MSKAPTRCPAFEDLSEKLLVLVAQGLQLDAVVSGQPAHLVLGDAGSQLVDADRPASWTTGSALRRIAALPTALSSSRQDRMIEANSDSLLPT